MKEKLKIAVCDDDSSLLEIITGATKSTFSRKGQEVAVEIFDNASALWREMRESKFDLIFLDIDMPGTDGITLGMKIREKRIKTDIVYVSGREDRVFESFQVHPFGFIRKSNFLKDIVAVVDLYLSTNKDSPDEQILFSQPGRGSVSLNLKEIKYIEGNKKYQLVYTESKKEPYEIFSSLRTLEERLTEKGFLRIHKGYLVNYRFIRFIDDNEIALTDNTVLPIGRRRLQEIRARYLELMQENETVI